MDAPSKAPLAMGLATALALTAARASADTCAETLRVEAREDAASALRTEVRRGRLGTLAAEECTDATVRLAGGPDRWVLTLDHAGQRQLREVESVRLAAVWLESWLDPGVDGARSDPFTPRADSGPVGAPVSDGGPRPAPNHTVRGVMTLAGGAAGVAPDGSAWVGPTLTLGVPLGRLLWVGPAGAAAFRASGGGPQSARLLSGGLAAGVRADLGKRLWLLAAVSGGAASFSASTGTKGGAYVGVGGALGWELVEHVSLLAGLGTAFYRIDPISAGAGAAPPSPPVTDAEGETEDELEEDGVGLQTPTASTSAGTFEPPSFLGSAALSVAITFGGP